MSRLVFPWWAFFAVAWAFQVGNVLTERRHEPEGYLYGDSNFYAAAADSLLRDRDLDLFNQCFAGKKSVAEALPILEGKGSSEYGWAEDGYLTLKQSPLLSVAALPFYAVFGKPGCLYFNVVVLNLLLVGMVKLGGDSSASRLAVLAGFVSTPLWRYTFNYSPDIFLCALLVWSVWAARDGRAWLAGLLAGLAVGTKIYVAALLLPLPLVQWFAPCGCRRKAEVKLVVGGIVGLLPGLAFNTWLFGAPWVTGYERQLHVENGVFGLKGHVSLFNVPPLEGLRNLMLDDRLGLVWTTPLWFAWPVAATVLLWSGHSVTGHGGESGHGVTGPQRGRAWVAAASFLIVANVAVFAPYSAWDATRVGSRYLFPATVFGFALIAAAAHALFVTSAPASVASSESGKPCAI